MTMISTMFQMLTTACMILDSPAGPCADPQHQAETWPSTVQTHGTLYRPTAPSKDLTVYCTDPRHLGQTHSTTFIYNLLIQTTMEVSMRVSVSVRMSVSVCMSVRMSVRMSVSVWERVCTVYRTLTALLSGHRAAEFEVHFEWPTSLHVQPRRRCCVLKLHWVAYTRVSLRL